MGSSLFSTVRPHFFLLLYIIFDMSATNIATKIVPPQPRYFVIADVRILLCIFTMNIEGESTISAIMIDLDRQLP